jgi:N-acetylmuramoyl-L-alanine amidase
MILRMIHGCSVVGTPRRICWLFLSTLLLTLFAVQGSPKAHWDSDAAARSFRLARQKRSEIAQTSQPALEQYLECAKTYRQVYLNNPHYGRAADALYEEAVMYQDAADRFLKPEYYKLAVKGFRLLIKDYGSNSRCPHALIRLASIYSKHLNDESAAQEAYRRLKNQYKYTAKAIEKMRDEVAPKARENEAAGESTTDSAPKTEPHPGARSTVQNIRFWSMDEYTRVIIDLDFQTRYEKSRLFSPDRIYFDISNAKLSEDLLNRAFNIGDDILKQVRVAQNRFDMVRVVLDISGVADVSISEMSEPFRIVVDLRRQGSVEKNSRQPGPAKPDSSTRKEDLPLAIAELKPASEQEKGKTPAEISIKPMEQEYQPRSGESSSGILPKPNPKEAASVETVDSAKKPVSARADEAPLPKEATPNSRGGRTLTRTLGLKVGRIVIDPGHGGHDFGTIGPSGLPEKTLVLALAQGLRKMIQDKIGAEVVLTRDTDTFIPLEERTALANQHKADLFISIHANSSRIHSISGVETYYLDFAKTDSEREIAARENATNVNNVRDLEDLIKKIARADKSTESRELASIMQKKLYSGARQILPSTKNRGVRSAPFIVLIGANMPSVLAEVAFISNPKVEKLLAKETTRQALIKALFTGIEGYMKTLGSETVPSRTSRQSK